MKKLHRCDHAIRPVTFLLLCIFGLAALSLAICASLASPAAGHPGRKHFTPASSFFTDFTENDASISSPHPTLHLTSYHPSALVSHPIQVVGVGYSLPQYTLTDLGPSSNGGYYGDDLGLNDAGDVVGDGAASAGSVYTHGYVWDPVLGAENIGALSTDSSTGGSESTFGYLGSANPYSLSPIIGFQGGAVEENLRPNNSVALNSSEQITGSSAIVYSTSIDHAILWSQLAGLIDLGALPAYPTGNSYGAAINSFGQIAGGAQYILNSNQNNNSNHAFLWTPTAANAATGAMQELGVIGDSSLAPTNGYSLGSFAYGVNAGGEVVGLSDAGNGYSHAFLWSPTTPNTASGMMTDLQTLMGGSANSAAFGINDAGDIFGVSHTNGLTSLLYDGGSVGTSEGGHAFLWTPSVADGASGSMTDLGVLATDYDYGSTPTAMNSSGEVVGQSSINGINPVTQVPQVYTGNGSGPLVNFVPYGHAFLYPLGGPMQDLGSLYCGPDHSEPLPYGQTNIAAAYNQSDYTDDSWAKAINASGTVVGNSSEFSQFSYEPFVYTNGFMYNLNDLLTGSNVSGWKLTDADSVNSNGQIACVAIAPDGSTHAVLLTPTTPLTTPPIPTVPADALDTNGNVINSSLFPQNNIAGNPSFTLAINGSNFAPNADVTFNGDPMTRVVESDDLIEATIPASEITSPGNYRVIVANPGNTTSSFPALFTVLPAPQAPTIASLSPASAPADSQSLELTIQGTNFDSTSRVHWFENVTGYSINAMLTPNSVSADGTTLTVAIPAADILVPSTTLKDGNVISPITVTVIDSPNTTDTKAASAYSVTSNSKPFTVTNPAPTITGLSPASVPAGTAGMAVYVNGTGFNVSTTLTWNNPNDGTGATSPTSYYVSPTQMEIYLQSSDTTNPATVPITVTNPAALSDGSDGGSVTATLTIGAPLPVPTLTSLSPSSVVEGGPDMTLTINGSNFAANDTVQFGGSFVPATVAPDGSSLTVLIPAANTANPGPVTVTVTSPSNVVSNSLIFTVTNPAPTITSLNPAQIAVGSSGQTIVISGTGFDQTTTVTWNNPNDGSGATTPNYSIISATEIDLTVQSSDTTAAALVPITVTNPAELADHSDGGSATASLTIGAAPTVTTLNPNSATAGDPGFALTIAGSNFAAGATVQFGADSALVPTTVTTDGTGLTVNIPSSDLVNSGPVTVTVTNPGGLVSNSATFTVNPLVVTVSSVSLNPASLIGGNASTGTVTLSGPAPNAGASVTVTSDDPSATPDSVTIAAGAATGTFNIPTHSVTVITTANITATYNNSQASAALTVNPPLPTVVSVSLSPSSLFGGSPSTGTVTLSGDTPADVEVVLSSDNAAATPQNVLIPAGQASATFPVATTAVTAITTAHITAACDSSQASAALTINPPLPPPAAPTNVAASPASGVGVSLTWTGSSGAATYTILGVSSTGATTVLATGITGTSFTVTGLSPNTSYTFEVVAVNGGGSSAASSSASASTLLDPLLLTATAGAGSVGLSWTAAAEAGATYSLYRGLEPGSEVLYQSGLAGTSYTDSSVTNGQTYYYYVGSSDLTSLSNQADASPVDPAHPVPSSKLQLAVTTLRSWPGHASQFTVTITNTGGGPQYLSDAEVDAQTSVGVGWVGRDSALPTKPLAPGASVEATFNLDVPLTAVGGPQDAPVIVPLTLAVTGADVYQRNFNLEVYQKPPTTLAVTVVDNNNAPISGALIAFNKDPNLYGTDNNGQVTLPEASGSLTVYAYAKGFLPTQQNVHLTKGEAGSVTLTLTPGDPLSITSFTVVPISGSEAAADGVNVDDPKNYNVYKFTLKIGVETQTGVAAIPNGGGGGSSPPPGNGPSFPIYSLGGESNGTGGNAAPNHQPKPMGTFTPTGPNQGVVVWLTLKGQIHFLKEFFNAGALIYNDTPYMISNANASIDVPEGLSLPQLNNQDQPKKQTVGNINPYQTKYAEWVVEGKDPGQYVINGSTSGGLKLGGATVPVNSDLQASVSVEEPQLSLTYSAAGKVTKGTPFDLGIDVTNTGTLDLSDVTIDLTPSAMVNCYLPSSQDEQQDLGTVPAGGTVHVDYQVIPEVTGTITQLKDYVTNDPETMPQVKIKTFILEAKDENVSTPAGTRVTIDALKDAIAIGIGGSIGVPFYDAVTSASNGASAIDTKTKMLDYTPGSGFVGADYFGYSIEDNQNDVSTATVTVNVLEPQLGTISVAPSSVAVGSDDLAIKITGTGFYSGSTVSFNGAPLSGQVDASGTSIAAVIPAALLQVATPGVVTVSNLTSSANGTFTVTGNPAPYVTNLSPDVATAGRSVALTVSGIGFVPGSAINWNGAPLTTTFLNSGALSASVPAADLTGASASVTVSSPAPGGGASAPLAFTIMPSSPVLRISLGSVSRAGGVIAATFSLSNVGSQAATSLHVVSAKLLSLSGGKLASLPASSLTQPASGSLAVGASETVGASFTGSLPATGSRMILQVTLSSHEIVSSGASFATTAP